MAGAGAGQNESIIVVSDLHMSAGVDPLTAEMSAHDHFRADEAVVRFLDRLADRISRPPHGESTTCCGGTVRTSRSTCSVIRIRHR
jgi:hypothetical protein